MEKGLNITVLSIDQRGNIMKKLFIALIILTVFLASCVKIKDCGSDVNCINDAIVKGNPAKASLTLSVSEAFGDVDSKGDVNFLVESLGKDGDNSIVTRKVSSVNLSEGNDSLKVLENTEVTCKLSLKDLSSGDVKGVEDLAMTASLDVTFDNGLKISPKKDGPCLGSMLDAFSKSLEIKSEK